MRSLFILFACLLSISAQAQRKLGGEPGKFDFYVLALSWSPSFCEGKSRGGMQCAGDKPFSFVVHGLWPQFNKGYPEFCQMPSPELDRRTVSNMLDIMPAPNLVKHEWEKHGTCAGVSSYKYFETVRKARATVKIPVEYENLTQHLTVSGEEVEAAFIKSNPTLKSDMISVQCNRRNLSEVYICVGKDMHFVSCPEVDSRACRRDKMSMPPARM
jgi:ribonuclease T2